MKVGDLVKIEKWCKNKHRIAIITEVLWDVPWHALPSWKPPPGSEVTIQYVDELADPPSQAAVANLILLEVNNES